MPKLPNYRSNVFAVIAEYENKPFQWGKSDCAIFSSDIISAVYGYDPAAEWRGTYKTAVGGLRKIKSAGYEDQADWVRKNFTEVAKPFAQFGDLAIIEGNEAQTGFTIGVVGGMFILAMGQAGLARIPLSSAKSIYRGA